ncbi:chaperone modulator CbpM [Thioalkalivibrio sp. XN8]|uniref:chaperone modulator CbpM n=1 Tax=Thioalkalivibrio sp. XN8 TaxID=2712863 RepID=UPI0013EA38CE|nr:chaperone modulator CbpM [Thioalkalivibrio sp. XN8]NGP53730.1 MerR family transcriptional regulator [Thioalkalivibrio sp. XN8]
MTRQELEVLMGQVLDESLELGLEELCRMAQADEAFVVALVAEGVIEPSGATRTEWRFTGRSVCRTQVALRLHRDLDVNLPGVALALDLLEEIRRLR